MAHFNPKIGEGACAIVLCFDRRLEGKGGHLNSSAPRAHPITPSPPGIFQRFWSLHISKIAYNRQIKF